MKIKDLYNYLKFAKELINVFADYSVILDTYYSKEENRSKDEYSYFCYKDLEKNVKDLKEKYNL